MLFILKVEFTIDLCQWTFLEIASKLIKILLLMFNCEWYQFKSSQMYLTYQL